MPPRKVSGRSSTGGRPRCWAPPAHPQPVGQGAEHHWQGQEQPQRVDPDQAQGGRPAGRAPQRRAVGEQPEVEQRGPEAIVGAQRRAEREHTGGERGGAPERAPAGPGGELELQRADRHEVVLGHPGGARREQRRARHREGRGGQRRGADPRRPPPPSQPGQGHPGEREQVVRERRAPERPAEADHGQGAGVDEREGLPRREAEGLAVDPQGALAGEGGVVAPEVGGGLAGGVRPDRLADLRDHRPRDQQKQPAKQGEGARAPHSGAPAWARSRRDHAAQAPLWGASMSTPTTVRP
jgi:hypothetical protein